MYNIKRHWNIIFLHLLAHIIKGVTYTKADIGTVRNGCIPIVRANNIQGDKLDYKDLVWVVESRIAPDQFLRQGDVVVATSSGSKHLVGKTASFDGKQKISCGAFCAILRPNNLVDNLFFKYFFQTQEYRNLISSYAKGSNINNLKNGDLAKIQIPVPPMAEQKRIVRKIEELFGLIDRDIQRLTDTLEQLSQFRQSVLHQAFSGKLYKTTNWTKKTLQDLCLSVAKRKDSKNEQEHFLYLDIASIDNQTNTIIGATPHTGVTAPSRARQIVKNGDVLFSTVRTYLKNIALITDEKYHNQIASTGFCVIRANKKQLLPKFIYYYTLTDSFLSPLNAKQRGSSYPAVRDSDVLNSTIYLPTLPEQQKIVDEIEKAFRSADKVQKAVQNALEEAKKLKQSILKKAFAGELVPQDPNDKPVDLTQIKKDKQK
ncbi:restriction endonuclease subunit S [Candidatus Avelusimicrobium fimicolum]|uniref:restriction endonuclease subunit S n=1 Tax=Candidatus Avelusimicrobium fimicolum TaxID=3416216 RepID=UPI003D11BF4D